MAVNPYPLWERLELPPIKVLKDKLSVILCQSQAQGADYHAKSIYKFGLSVCLSVCLFVSNKRQNG